MGIGRACVIRLAFGLRKRILCSLGNLLFDNHSCVSLILPATRLRRRAVVIGFQLLLACALSSPFMATAELGGIQAIATGSYGSHTCALTTVGGVKCWGFNDHGQLGDGTTTDRSIPTVAVGLSMAVQAIATGGYQSGSHTCVLFTTGGVKCWGSNNYGQLGDGTTTDRTTAVDAVGLTDGVQAISLGAYHSCALTTEGTVKCWGYNYYGQLGDGSTTNRTTAVSSLGLSGGIIAIALGGHHSCGVTSVGGVKCWGWNINGQLGDGTTTSRTAAVGSSLLSTGIQSVNLGYWHSCAITDAGGVKCWGSNSDGQLGDGTTTNRSTAVDSLALVAGVQAISLGTFHTCAITTVGGVKCWGSNGYGQLAYGTLTDQYSAVDSVGLSTGIHAIKLGYDHTCALTTTGGVKCWGRNKYGHLGDGSTTARTSAVHASGLSAGVNVITLGSKHTCVVTAANEVGCWGDNSDGQLGDNSTTDRYSAVNSIGLSAGVQSITSRGKHSCALTATSGVACWGDNLFGQLGDGTTSDRYTAVTSVGLSTGIQSIELGYYHSCALTTVGSVKCWGRNNYGQLGDSTTTQRTAAIEPNGLSAAVHEVKLGYYHTCALTTLGSVKCWGRNDYGQLGDGSTTDRTTAVDAIGLTAGVQAISLGSYHSCALTTAGGTKCWGSNSYGQLGDGSITDRLEAVDLIALTTGIQAIALGYRYTCALTTTGGVRCLGYNNYGQLGDGTTIDRVSAVTPLGLAAGVHAIALGDYHTCAITTAGGVKCWGYNDSGQLGEVFCPRRNRTLDKKATGIDVVLA